MSEYIDIYCERLAPGLLAEPINAVTNAAFFIAAFYVYQWAKTREALSPQSLILIALMCAIGVGSTLFHTHATKLTQLSDVLPILFYQIAFIWFYSLHVIKLNALKTAGLFVVFMVMTVLSEMAPSHILNGSLGYAPSITFLLGFGIWHYKTKQSEPFILLLAALVFSVSLTFRSIDMMMCETIVIGTHFLWHVLNGCVLYLATRGYVNAAKTQSANEV